MKKLFFILLILIFASSASATVYKWVDENGAINFADDYDKVPPQYRNRVEEMNMPRTGPSTPSGKAPVDARSGEKTKQPPIAQTLVREGDFAMKLAESLKIGKPAGEAEAESILATAGIAPKNGWIADYPVTPDIIGELTKAVGEAADAKKLGMGKEEAFKALRTAAAELELPIIAEVPDEYNESSSPTAPEYAEPPAGDDYYYAEGPPVITYYLPPPDYYYLYAWVPSPFWCSGFFFPGFFILHDFHRFHHHWHGHPYYVTNHIRDPQTRRIVTIDPVRRREGKTVAMREATHTQGFSSTEAKSAARSIFERSSERSKIPSTPTTGRDYRNPVYPRYRTGNQKQAYSTQSRTPGESGIRGYGRPFSMNRQNRIYAQRPSTGQPFHAPSLGGGRSFSPAPQGGGQHFSSPSHGGGFSGSHQGGGGGGSFGHGGSFRK